MSRWLPSCRLRVLAAVPSLTALNRRLSPAQHLLGLEVNVKFPGKQQRDAVTARTSCFKFGHISQVRGLSSQTAKPSSSGSSQATFIDLYAGIGGFHRALVDNGLRCVYANENSAAAAKTYERNYCKAEGGHGGEGISRVDRSSIIDVVSQRMHDIPEHTVLAAGFPCQPYSNAGKREGFDCKKHGNHLEQIGKIVEARRPAVVVLENVRSFGSPKFRGTEVAAGMLEPLGYWFSHRVYNAWDFDLPQNRSRIIMVAVRKDLVGPQQRFEMPDPPRQGHRRALRECLLPPEETQCPEGMAPVPLTEFPVVDGVRMLAKSRIREAVLSWTDVEVAPDSRGELKLVGWLRSRNSVSKNTRKGDYICHDLGPMSCLMTSHNDWILTSGAGGGAVVRQLYRREMARIMGFPESFTPPEQPGLATHQFGNAVPPPMIDLVVRELRKCYPHVFEGTPRPLLAKL